MKPLRILFLGTPSIAVPTLEALASHSDIDVRLVVTQEDKPVGRKRELTPPPIKVTAEQLQIPVLQPASMKDEATLEALKKHGPYDFVITFAFGHILPDNILKLAEIAPLNVHASLLPRWRGASPIEHSILAGDTDTGLTIQRMVSKLDAGAMLNVRNIPMTNTTTAEELRDIMATEAPKLLIDTILNPLQETEQDEEQATYCHKLSRVHGHCTTQQDTAEEINRKVRALNPWPGVTLIDREPHLKLLKASLEEQPGSTPLACKENTVLHLVEVQSAGKKAMSGADWARGQHGSRLIGLGRLAPHTSTGSV